jgi:hypothetical protein
MGVEWKDIVIINPINPLLLLGSVSDTHLSPLERRDEVKRLFLQDLTYTKKVLLTERV